MKKKPRSNAVSVESVQSKFDSVLKQASEENERFVVYSGVKPKVLIIGINDYFQTFGPQEEILDIIGEKSRQRGTDKITMDETDDEITKDRLERQKGDGTSKNKARA